MGWNDKASRICDRCFCIHQGSGHTLYTFDEEARQIVLKVCDACYADSLEEKEF